MRILLCGIAAGAFLAVAPASAANPDALWNIVGGKCDVHMAASGDPAPCARVDLARGFAVLKDNSPAKPEAYLLIPSVKITGIDDPSVLSPDAPNYFEDAWEARSLVEEKLHADLPRDDFALAINSIYARTQEQFHIHVDCVRADVRDLLRRDEAAIGAGWTPLTERVNGHRYRAMRIRGDDLSNVRPFQLLARGVPGAADHMGLETLVAIGAVFADGSPGFYLLTDQADMASGDRAEGEELIDSTCALRGSSPAAAAP